MMAMIGRIGPTELVLMLAIALVIFGPKKLPEIGKAIGQSIREFKSGSGSNADQAGEHRDEIGRSS